MLNTCCSVAKSCPTLRPRELHVINNLPVKERYNLTGKNMKGKSNTTECQVNVFSGFNTVKVMPHEFALIKETSLVTLTREKSTFYLHFFPSQTLNQIIYCCWTEHTIMKVIIHQYWKENVPSLPPIKEKKKKLRYFRIIEASILT